MGASEGCPHTYAIDFSDPCALDMPTFNERTDDDNDSTYHDENPTVLDYWSDALGEDFLSFPESNQRGYDVGSDMNESNADLDDVNDIDYDSALAGDTGIDDNKPMRAVPKLVT